MAETTNYKLKKPSAEDFYDIGVHNANMDIIDNQMKKMSDDVDDTIASVLSHSSNKKNPHNVTATAVGLGNVPNVTTNDQTPTYTEASTLTNLASGEKLSSAFGKIKKAISSLISHLADTTKHITSTERTKWNTATDTANSASALLANGGFEHLLDYEVNLPVAEDKGREFIIPMPIETFNATAIKLIVKGRISGEIIQTSDTAAEKVKLFYAVDNDSTSLCYQQNIGMSKLGTFCTEEFEIPQEFTVSRKMKGTTTQPISQNVENPPITVTYAYPRGNSYNTILGDSNDITMLLVHESGYAKVGFVGTIEVYIR